MTDVYRIGVSIAMASNAAQVLGVMGRDLLGIHNQVGKLGAGFSRLKLAIGGALAIGAGVAVLAGVKTLLSATEDLSREQAKMRAAGLSNKDVAEATGRAWQMSATIMGARVSENLAAVAHLRAALGDLHEAERIAPSYQRNAVALNNITGRDGEGEAFKLAQAIHLSGSATDPITKRLRSDLFSSQMNLYTAMIAAGGGKLQASDLLQFQKQAGSYGGNLTNEGRIDLIGAIQASGGTKVGTQLSSLNRAIKDGILQKSTLMNFEKVGLIDPSKVVHVGGGHGNGASPGGGVSFKPGALTNEALFRASPARWVWETLIPKLNAAGITSTDDQVNWIQHAKLTANPTRLLAELIRNKGVDQQEAANVRIAAKADQYSNVMATSLPANTKALHDAWRDMLTALGAPLVKPAIGALQAITGAIKGVTAWATVNPDKVRLIGKTLVVVGVGLIGLGVAAVAVAAFAAVAAGGAIGVIVAAIAGIGSAVTALVLLNWPAVKGAVSGLADFVHTVLEVGAYIVAHPIKGLLTPVKDLPKAAAAQAAADSKAKPQGHYAYKMDWQLGVGRKTWVPDAAPRPSAAPPPAANQNLSVTTHLHLDGRQVATVVNKHNARDMNRAATGGSTMDPRASLPQASGATR